MWAYALLVVLLLLLLHITSAKTEYQSNCSTTASNIQECEESILWLRNAIDEDTKKYNEYLVKQQQYNNAIAAWESAHNTQLGLLEAGRRTTNNEIWHNNQKYNCETGQYVVTSAPGTNTVGGITYGGGVTSTGMVLR